VHTSVVEAYCYILRTVVKVHINTARAALLTCIVAPYCAISPSCCVEFYLLDVMVGLLNTSPF
jgi:hypothetical protein